MNPEQLLLRFFIKDKENFEKYSYVMSNLTLDKEFTIIYSTISKYYEVIPTHDYISQDEFTNFFVLNHGTYKDKEFILEIVNHIYALDVSDSLILEVIKNLVEKDTANKVIQKLMPVLTENKYGVLSSVDEDIKHYLNLVAKHDKISPFNESTFEELIQEHIYGEGLRWRLECLQNDIGLVRPGHLLHVFARPDTGKTSFLCSEIGYMASQIEDDEEILWFCNEENSGRIKLRLYTTILDKPIGYIIDHKEKAMELFAERGGNKIKFMDDSVNLNVIRTTCFEYKPRLVVVDSGDKVSFSGDKQMDGALRLKELYWRYRQLANEFNVPVVTVAQAGGEAAGKKWLEMHQMDYSKTGKAGEMDAIIGVGMTLEGETGLRYINLPKNKINGIKGKHSVSFDPTTGRYKD